MSTGILISLFAVRVPAANLTALFVFSTDAEGNPAGDFAWDTRGLDSDFYKVFIAPGEPGSHHSQASFINGPMWAQAPIDLSLKTGKNKFTLFFQANGPWDRFGVNLFFDGNRLPAISVYAPLTVDRHNPGFLPNSAPVTYTMTSYPFPDGPAAGTASADFPPAITLTDFYVLDPTLLNLDRVDTHSAFSNGAIDFVASFTLQVGNRN